MNLYNKICVVTMKGKPDKDYVARVITDNGYIVQVQLLGHSFKLTVGKPLADYKFNQTQVPTFYACLKEGGGFSYAVT